MTSSYHLWLRCSVGWSIAPASRGHGFKPRGSPEFFRLLYAIAKIALVTVRIIALLDFISAVLYTIHFIFIISFIEFLNNKSNESLSLSQRAKAESYPMLCMVSLMMTCSHIDSMKEKELFAFNFTFIDPLTGLPFPCIGSSIWQP